jgi:hypothetical protein
VADAEFDSERNHTFVRQQLHAVSVIPAKRGKKTWRIHGEDGFDQGATAVFLARKIRKGVALV